MPSSGFNISGSAKDNNSLSLSIKETFIDKNTKKETVTNKNVDIIDNNWSIHVPLSGTVVEGEYSFEFSLKDIANNTVLEKTPSSIVDTALPIITITSPSEKLGVHAVNELNYRFAGLVKDVTGGTAPLYSVWYKITNQKDYSSNAPLSGEGALKDSNWTTKKWLKASIGTSSWDFYEPIKEKGSTSNGLEEGKYSLIVYAVDEAGNRSDKATVDFDVDLKAPILTENRISKLMFNERDTSFTIGGIAEDSNTLESLSYNLADGNEVPLTIGEKGVWEKKFTIGKNGNLKDGKYTITITAKDNVGKETKVIKNIIVDTKKPTADIVIDGINTEGWNTSKLITVHVNNVVEDVSGIKSIKAVINGKEVSLNNDKENNYTGIISSEEKDNNTLYFTLTDNVDNITTTSVQTIKVDTTAPQVSETNEIKQSDGVLTLKGKVSDTNKLSTDFITIFDKEKKITYKTNKGITLKPITEGKEYEWTLDFVKEGSGVNIIDEGKHTFEITVKDIAGRTSMITRSVLVDKTAPEAKVTLVGKNGEWIQSSQIKIIVDNITDNGSGIENVTAKVGQDGEVVTLSKKIDSQTNSVSFTGTVTAKDGENNIIVELSDKVGNKKTYTNTIKVDAELPTFSLANVFDIDENGKRDITKITPKLVNANKGKKLQIILNVSDGLGSGIESVNLEKIGSKIFNKIGTLVNGKYEIEVPLESCKGNVLITVKDNVGNTHSDNIFDITIDGEAPLSSINAIGDADTTTKDKIDVNKTITLSGSVSDNNALQSAFLEYTLKGVDSWETYGEITKLDYNWSMDVDTTNKQKFSDGSEYTFRIKATDNAGNVSTTKVENQLTVFVNSDSDKPIITFNDIALKGMGNTQDNFAKLRKDTVTGTIFDDDGVTSLSYRLGETGKFIPITIENGSWNFKFNKQGNQKVYFKIVDKANTTWTSISNTSSSIPIKLKGSDNEVSSESILNVFVDTVAPIITETSSVSVTNKEITLGGTVSDNNGFGSNSIVITSNLIKEGKKEKVFTVDASKAGKDTPFDWSCNISQELAIPGDHVVTIKVSDKAGNEASVSRNIKIDRTLPEGTVSIVDTTGNEIENNKWFNSSQVRVCFKGSDKESGIESVTAQVISNETTGQEVKGDIVTLSPNDDKSAYFAYVNVPEGSANNIHFITKDIAGNILESAINGVKVDTVRPEITKVEEVVGSDVYTELNETKAKLVNGNSNLTLRLTANDKDGSGIKDIELTKLFGKPLDPVLLEKHTYDDFYQIKIDKSKFSEAAASGAVGFVITDNAGNKDEVSLFTLTVDKISPTLTMNEVMDANSANTNIDVNGVITLSGTLSDNYGIKSGSVELQYASGKSDNSKTSWTTYATIPDANYSWSINVDTTAAGKFNDNSFYLFRLVAKDEAGNEGDVVSKPLYINASSDKSVISLTNLTIPQGEENWQTIPFDNTRLYGTIFDDDGIKEASYAIVDSLPSTLEDVKWVPLTLGNGGTWDITLEQGTKYIIFKCIDSGSDKKNDTTDDKTFTSISGENDKVIVNGTNLSALHLKVDTIPPSLGKIKYQVVSNLNEFVDEDPASGSKWKQLAELSEDIMGGSVKRYLKFKIPASDDNGISEITLKGELKKSGVGDVINCNKDTFLSDVIDISSFKKDAVADSVSFPLTITVKDTANKTTTLDINLIIDNKAPHLTIDSHKSGANIRSEFLLKGLTDDANSKIQYVINGKPTIEDYEWNNAKEYSIAGNKMSWGIHFDKKEVTDTFALQNGERMHDLHPKEYFFNVYKDKYGLSKDPTGKIVYGNNEPYTKLLPLYFHFRLTDERGNSKDYNDFSLIVDPQGGMPVTSLTYPVIKDGKAPTVSGTIRLQGTADDDKQITDIYMQIDKAYNGKKFKPMTEKEYENNYAIAKDKYDKPILIKNHPVIRVGEGLTWNFNINEKGEFNPSQDKLGHIAIVLYAKDDEGQISEGTKPFHLIIDATSPRIGSSIPFTLNQYKWVDSNGVTKAYSTTSEGTTLYSDEKCTISLSGTPSSLSLLPSFNTVQYESGMWLKGTWFLNGSVEDESGINTVLINGEDVVNKKDYTNTAVNTKGYEITHKITDSVIKIETTDKDSNGGKTSTEEFKVNFDNLPPRISDENQDNLSVYNDNGFFTLKSEASEDGSGFDKAIFYFTSVNEDFVYDSFIKKDVSGNKNDGKTLTKDNGLWWTKEKGSVSGNSITLTSVPSNVHVGGLLKVKGAIYTISSINGNVVTVKSNIPEIKGDVDVYFAFGHVVDHFGTETPGRALCTTDLYYGYYVEKGIPDDDGDRMVEKVSEIGNRTIWNGSINSNNIPDGMQKLNYVVFDKAGNIAQKSINVKVSNNSPRLASLSIWSDYNRNTQKDTDEVDTFYFAKKEKKINGVWQPRATDVTKHLVVSGNGLGKEVNTEGKTGSSYKTIKDEFTFIPEIVGGNGKLWYSYNIGNEQLAATDLNASGNADGIDTIAGDGMGYLENDEAESSYVKGQEIEIKVDGTLLNRIGNSIDEKNPTWFTYTISDSTGSVGEATYSDENSLSATFDCALNVQYQDSTPPTCSIKPFYFNSESDNSLWDNSRKNGHIEIGNELDKTVFNGTTTLLDTDDKVSGKIRIDGKASDNIKLSELYITFPGINGGQKLLVSKYDPATGKWVAQNVSKDNSWNFTATDESYVKDGEPWHNVVWSFNVDTSIINNSKVGLEQKFNIEAIDERGGLTSSVVTKKMDVVPYITGVERTSTKGNSTRSRSGAVPLMRGEQARISGFNLSSTSLNVNIGNVAVSNPTIDESTSSVLFTVSDTAYTGSLNLSVNKIDALNNKNNDTLSYNKEEGTAYYENENGEKSSYFVSDNRTINVWRVDKQDTFKGSKNCVYPAMAKDKDGKLYASFTNYGQSKTYYTNSFVGPNAVGTSSYTGEKQDWWNTVPDPSLQDGVATVFNGYDPPEETDIAVDQSTGEVNVFYAANYHGGNANNWNGTSVSDAGGIYIFDKDAAVHDNSRTVHNLYRGELYTYDDELNQFKNMRILRNGGYIYTAYYDRLRGAIKMSVVTDDGTDTNTNAMGWVTIDGVTDSYDKGQNVSYSQFYPFVVKGFEGINRTDTPGESVALSLDKEGKPVVVYMDAASGNLRLARANSKSPTTDGNWKVQSVFTPGDKNIGKVSGYISSAIGNDGALHIVFQNTQSKLVYLKGTKQSSGSYKFEKSTVIDDCGIWVDVTVKEEGQVSVPYISYIARTNAYDGMKLAYKDSSSIGGWETMTAPSNEKITGVRTCIETNALAYNDNTKYAAAIGFCPGSDYRAMFYVGKN